MPYHHRVALIQLRTHIPITRCNLSERREHIYIGDSARRPQYRLRITRHLLAHLPEQSALDLPDAVLRVQNERLVLLHLRRDEPLAAHQRLPPHIIFRRKFEIGVADLDVVAEDSVVAHLQRLDACTLPFLLLQAGNIVLRVTGRTAHLVQLRREPGPNYIAVSHTERRVIRNRLPDKLHDFAIVRDLFRDPLHLVRIIVFAQNRLDFRRGIKAACQTHEIARVGIITAHPVHQPLHIRHIFQEHHHSLTPQRAAMKPLHRVLPPQEPLHIQQRLPKPASQQPPAHRGFGHIQH